MMKRTVIWLIQRTTSESRPPQHKYDDGGRDQRKKEGFCYQSFIAERVG